MTIPMTDHHTDGERDCAGGPQTRSLRKIKIVCRLCEGSGGRWSNAYQQWLSPAFNPCPRCRGEGQAEAANTDEKNK